MIQAKKKCGLLTSSHIFSRIGIHDVARWQFCSTTQSPTSIAYRESIINQSINLLFLLVQSGLKSVTKFNEIISSKVGVLDAGSPLTSALNRNKIQLSKKIEA